jgi:outer membrane protein OmpA-like peptidoglycan-associated protein
MSRIHESRVDARPRAARPVPGRRPPAFRLAPAGRAAAACVCGGGCPRCDGAEALRPGDSGRPLPERLRERYGAPLGGDLGEVRIHADDPRPARLGAAAYTLGNDVVLGPGRYRPDTAEGRRLLVHELTHVAQQRAARTERPRLGPAADRFEREAERNAEALAGPLPGRVEVTPRPAAALQRRLLMTGSDDDVNGLLDLIGPPAGVKLKREPSPEVRIAGPGATLLTSPSLFDLLNRAINDPKQDAELQVGQQQPKVLVGLFPQPHDLTGSKVQTVDLDDIRALEAGAPGNGVAAVAHEIEENFQAHGVTPVPGVSRFDAAHEAAIRTESNVAEELVGPGRRVARRIVEDDTVVPNLETQSIDYQNYYLVIDATDDPQTRNRVITKARRADHVEVSRRTIDHYGFNSIFVPGSGQAELKAAVKDVQDNNLSTITIEGFADSVGSAEANLAVSRQRAEQARDAMINAGVDAGREKERFNIVARGSDDPAGDNASEEGRAQNRRVVIIVSRPGT